MTTSELNNYGEVDPPVHSFIQRDAKVSTTIDLQTPTMSKQYSNEHIVLHFDTTNIDKLLVHPATELVRLVLNVTETANDIAMDGASNV